MRVLALCVLSLSLGCSKPTERIHRAATEGDAEAVQALLAKDPALAKHRAKDDLTPLLETKSAKVAALLLAAGASLEDGTGAKAMALARSGEIVDFLVEHGVSAQVTSGHCASTALHTAVSADGVQALVRHGLKPNAPDACKATPLHTQARVKETWVAPVIQALVDAGADVEARTSEGNPPMFSASPAAIAALRAAGADLESRTRLGETPLIRAVVDRDVARAEALLKAGANPNARLPTDVGLVNQAFANAGPGFARDRNATPLKIARSQGQKPMIELLEKAGGTE